MRSLHSHHHAFVTAQPLRKGESRVCAQHCTRQTDGEIGGELYSRRAALLSVAASLVATPARAVTSTSPYEDAKTMQYGLDSERSNTVSACFGTCFALQPAFVSRKYNIHYDIVPRLWLNCSFLPHRRIRTCPGAVNPNCVSTRSLSQVRSCWPLSKGNMQMQTCACCMVAVQMYSPAWRAAEPDPRTATKLFENALKRVCPEAQVVKQMQMPDADFRAFSVAGLYGQDIIE